MNVEQKEILRKKRILEYAEASGNILKTCRHFGVSRSNFYIWRTAYRRHGDAGLVRKKPIARSHPNQTPAEIVEKVLYLEPSIKGDFRCFLATATGYGTVGVRKGKPFYEAKAGTLDIRETKYVRREA